VYLADAGGIVPVVNGTGEHEDVTYLRGFLASARTDLPSAWTMWSSAGLTETTMPWVLRLAFTRPEPLSNWEIHRIGWHVLHARALPPRPELVPWDVADRWPEAFALLLAAWLQPDGHAALVAEALAAGLVDAAVAARVGPPADRPLWLSGEEPWGYAGVREAGTVRLPDGRLAACDPVWGRDEGLPIPILLAPGSYAVTLATATHPCHDEAGSVAIVLAVSGTRVARWEPAPEREYVPEAGLACFGAMAALETREEILPLGLNACAAGAETLDLAGAGTVVIVTIVEQYPTCRTWVGRDVDGAIVQVLTDLGLLGLDPIADPMLPWEAAAG
jgi:hypothetical protein